MERGQTLGGMISIHALREEGDPCLRCKCWTQCYFYPRPPRGGRPLPQQRKKPPPDFYPRPPRGGRRAALHYT